MSGRPRRTIVTVVGGGEDDPWRLPASAETQKTWIFGGERTMYELAVALASVGHDVEFRGLYSRRELDEMCADGRPRPRTDLPPRRPRADDVVIVPEGSSNPLFYARIALSPARTIMYLLAAPGLFGPGILPGFRERPALEVRPEEVSRPEHYRALRDAGFELWTDSPAIREDSGAAGVECVFTGTGQMIPRVGRVERRYDVAYLADNRWANLSRKVAAGLDASVLEIQRAPRDEVVRAMASARVLIHPAVVEGQSRVQFEARAVGTVTVSLRSNRYVAGIEEGGVLVDSLDDMAAEVERLLANPDELEERSRLSMRSAARQTDWQTYVRAVGEAISAPPLEDPLRPLRAALGDAIEVAFDELRDRREQVAARDGAVAWLQGAIDEGVDRRAALEAEVRWLREVLHRRTEERDHALRSTAAMSRRRSVRLADRIASLIRGRRRTPGAGLR